MAPDLDLRSLDPEPPTPSRVDVGRAIADGRRRRVHRRLAYAGAATLAVVVVAGASVAAGGLFADNRQVPGTTGIPGTPPPTTPAAPTSCTVEKLPAPDDAPTLLAGADRTGRWIVGRSYPEAGGYQAVVWHDGTPEEVPLPGDQEEMLEDVNSTGTAVGWSYEGSGPVPYAYRDGEVSRLPGVERGSALAVNDAGAIAGESGGAPLLWPSATEEPTHLAMPADASAATVVDIDEDGTVVGNLDDQRPYVWLADGTHHALPLPTVAGEQAANGRVFTVLDGWAIGLADDDPAEGGMSTAVRWQVRTGEVQVVDELDISVNTVNAQGWQVGSDKAGNPVLVTDTGTVALPDLGRGPQSVSPEGLSDDGRVITGQEHGSGGTTQAVAWHCE